MLQLMGERREADSLAAAHNTNVSDGGSHSGEVSEAPSGRRRRGSKSTNPATARRRDGTTAGSTALHGAVESTLEQHQRRDDADPGAALPAWLPHLRECTQHAGDVFYIPHGWGHAVLNGEDVIGVAMEFGSALGFHF